MGIDDILLNIGIGLAICSCLVVMFIAITFLGYQVIFLLLLLIIVSFIFGRIVCLFLD